MLTYPLHALLLGSSSVAVTAKDAHHRNRNLPNQKEFGKELYGASKQSAALREKFISKSKFVGGRKLQNNGYYSNAGYWVSNNNNDNNNNNYNYNNDEAEAEADADGEEYTYNEDGNQVYNDDSGAYDGYAFNPSNYAMAYHRCASVKQFDTDVASEEDAEVVFTTKTFAIFRFCPVDSCDEYVEEASDDAARRLEGDDAAGDDAAAEENATEEQSKYGARGKGCKNNYGEYMIELQDYLGIMMEYQQGRLPTYCSVCEEYMYDMYMSYNDDDGHDDDGGRKLFSFSSSSKTYEEFKSDPASHRMLEVNYSLCRQYANVCGKYSDDDDDSDDDNYAAVYTQCTESSGVYIGPHCSNDGFTITLGAHSDDACTEYVGDVAESDDDDDDDDGGDDGGDDDDDADADGEFDVMSYINSRYGGLSLMYEGQESSMCIPCYQDDDFSSEYNNDDDDGDDGNGGAMSVLCQQLYESSAHCERHYKTYNKKYHTYAQKQNEQLSCSYMDSIVMGNYDEMGYVNIKWKWGLWGNNTYWEKRGDGNTLNASSYAATSRRVSALQVLFLVFTCLSCAILGVWAKTLHSSLTKESWSPHGASSWKMNSMLRREQVQPQQPQIAPSDSGIGASRGILGMWANTLHSSLTKESWSPRGASSWKMNNMFRREQVQPEQPQLAPSDSGIGASRVRSDGTSYYLS